MKPAAVRHWFEDFNRPAETVETAPPEPTFSASDLATARHEAWNEGFIAAGRGQARDNARATEQAFAALLARSDEIDRELERVAERNAAAITRWLVQAFVTTLPALASASLLGRARLATGLLQTNLRSQSRIEVRAGGGPIVACETMHDAWRQIEQWYANDPPPGDIMIDWQQGRAIIDTQRTWDQIRAAILPLAEDPDQMFTANPGEYLSHV